MTDVLHLPQGHQPEYVASVIIPAHNEERTIGRLLSGLARSAGDDMEILVVCNGCTDDTARIARDHGATVIELSTPSKREALRRGDRLARSHPRVYLDADVEISGSDLRRLAAAVSGGPHLAAGPSRVLPRQGVGRLVRWYYDVWEELPHVKSGLFGRGVIAVSRVGNERIRELPPSMSDDLVAAEAFAPGERTVLPDAFVVVHPPKTLRDLIRRRVRVTTGNAQADAAGLRGDAAKTSLRTVLAVGREHPLLLVKSPVLLAVALTARVMSRRAIRKGDFTTWLRDESSRQ